jgi:AraC-like DNA-binding protein
MLQRSMARPSKEPPSPSSLAPALVRLVRARGGDAALFACRFGLAADVDERDEAPMSAVGANDAIAAAAEILGEPYLGLSLPAELPRKRYGHAELAARASATVRDALVRIARYAPLVLPQLECVLDEDASEARWSAYVRGHPRGVGRHAHEYALAYALEHCRRESGHAIAPLRVWFLHARPPDLAPLHRFFGTRDLAFGADDSGFALASSVLDLPMQARDERLLVTAEELADAALRAQPRAGELASLVATRIRALLPGDASIEAVSRAMHMSARTLQRRLDDEGTRFSELYDAAREEIARAAVLDLGLPLAEIAHRLGFADLATFSRAFKRWTGKPPGVWRRR